MFANLVHTRMLFVNYSSLPGGPLGFSAQIHGPTLVQKTCTVGLIAEVLILGALVSWCTAVFSVLLLTSLFSYYVFTVYRSHHHSSFMDLI
jgi:hypothetical protein